MKELAPQQVAACCSAPNAFRKTFTDRRIDMMRGIELRRRGLRFLPMQAVKRALRLYMEVLRRQDPPEYLIPLESWGLRAGNRYAEKDTKSTLG